MTAVNEHTVNGFREKATRRENGKSKREGAKRPSASRNWEQYAQEGATHESDASKRESASEAERKIPPGEKYVPPLRHKSRPASTRFD